MADVHARFTALLPAYFADALSEADPAWMDRHRDECVECSGLFARLEARLPGLRDHAGHAPVSVLEDLAQPDSTLTALERQLVLQHLESCAACMAEAQTLGYRAQPQRLTRPVWLWRSGLAAAAALVLFVAIRREPPAPPVVPTPRVEHLPTPSRPSTATRLMLAEPTRSADSPINVAFVDSTTDTLVITLPPIFLTDSNAVTLRLLNATRVELLRLSIPATAMTRPIALEAPARPWLPGPYRLELVPHGDPDHASVRHFAFELRRREP